MLYSPAFQLRCLRTSSTASAISVVSARFAPWSGKSDAIRKSGSPSPSYRIGSQDADGRAVTSPSPPSPSSSPPQPTAAIAKAAITRTNKAQNPRFLTCSTSVTRCRGCLESLLWGDGKYWCWEPQLQAGTSGAERLSAKRTSGGGLGEPGGPPNSNQASGAEGGSRTHTGLAPHWILSPARLPVPPLRPAAPWYPGAAPSL